MSKRILEGSATREQSMTYAHLPFDVPEGTTALDVSYQFDEADSIIDIGVFDPRGADYPGAGFRGWSGSARRQFRITQDDATPGYMPGPLQAGTWHVCLGLYTIAEAGCNYRVEINLTQDDAGATGDFPALLTLSDAPQPTQKQPSGWYRGDLHTHTHNSDGDSTPEALIRHAESIGLHYLAITDHNVWTAHRHTPDIETNLLLIPGCEVTTYRGHWNVWGNPHWIDFRVMTADDMRRGIDDALEHGFLVSCNHPRPHGPEWDFPSVNHTHCIEVWNGPWMLFNDVSLSYWEGYLKQGRQITAVGGSDTHFLQQTHHARPGTPTTVIYCPGDPSPAALINNLKRGRAYITDAPDGPHLTLNSGVSMMGDTITHNTGDELNVTIEAKDAAGLSLELIDASGTAHVQDVTDHQWHLTLSLTPDKFLYARLRDTENDGHIRALTNPLYLRSNSE